MEGGKLGCRVSGERAALPYSAMTQGEAVSVLVRAFSATGEDAYLEGARRALSPMLLPIRKGRDQLARARKV